MISMKKKTKQNKTKQDSLVAQEKKVHATGYRALHEHNLDFFLKYSK